MRKSAILIVMLAVAACRNSASPEDAQPIAEPEAAAAMPVDSTTPSPAPAPAPAPDVPTTDDPPASDAPTASLAVEGEGLRAFNLLTGSARPLPFDSSRADTLGMLQAVLGTAPSEEGENIDCGANFARWGNGLSVWFSDDKFVGWSLAESAAALTTAGGIGLGSSRSELEEVYNAKIASSSLGIEFTAGGLAGLLDSSEPDSRITHLWAGSTCIAR